MVGTCFSVEIRPQIPERLMRLEELANDLYYSWDRSVRQLLRRLDEKLWENCNNNPKVFLRRIAQHKLDQAAHDPIFIAQYGRVLSGYDTYMRERPYMAIEGGLDPDRDLVAYFSAEFGFHQSMPIYAGGLGILAGDFCKAMSNLWVPFVGVGILYHQGYFTQRIQSGGEQQADYPFIAAENLPVSPALGPDGTEVRVSVELEGRSVQVHVWEARAGHIRLYLLDTDLEENLPDDRSITYKLYGGDNVARIRQEIVLGVGGVRALRALGVEPTVWHINEGHSGFLILERCREQIARGLAFEPALELVAAGTVFTTHTPVPAGHDIFDRGLMRAYFSNTMRDLGIDEDRFLSLGANQHSQDAFNMTALGLRGSRYHNGVSRLHGGVAAQMESHIWPQIPARENPIGYVTNGVDVDTFLGRSWGALFDMYMGRGWRAKITDQRFWRDFIDRLPDHVFLSVHKLMKAEMLEDARRRATIQYRRNGCTESVVRDITHCMDPDNPDVLVIGFARRFATYKRATLLFRDLERLIRLLGDPQRPVLILYAGKAHPNDEPGRQLIREVNAMSLRPELRGKVVLLEDYNLSMARKMYPGVDVWVNVPEYPKEACGTSGMKAAINGAVNVSVLDGWWDEAYDGQNGWAITPHPDSDPQGRDRQEASDLLDILEHDVIPQFFEHNANGEPERWVGRCKASMKTVLPRFNNVRMARDYLQHYYRPAAEQWRLLADAEAAGARQLAAWKSKVRAAWPGVGVRLLGEPPKSIRSNESLPVDVEASLNGLDPVDVVVECVLGRIGGEQDFVADGSVRMALAAEPASEGAARFAIDLHGGSRRLLRGGLEYYKIRVYPWHSLLSHPFECGCMLWL